MSDEHDPHDDAGDQSETEPSSNSALPAATFSHTLDRISHVNAVFRAFDGLDAAGVLAAEAANRQAATTAALFAANLEPLPSSVTNAATMLDRLDEEIDTATLTANLFEGIESFTSAVESPTPAPSPPRSDLLESVGPASRKSITVEDLEQVADDLTDSEKMALGISLGIVVPCEGEECGRLELATNAHRFSERDGRLLCGSCRDAGRGAY